MSAPVIAFGVECHQNILLIVVAIDDGLAQTCAPSVNGVVSARMRRNKSRLQRARIVAARQDSARQLAAKPRRDVLALALHRRLVEQGVCFLIGIGAWSSTAVTRFCGA